MTPVPALCYVLPLKWDSDRGLAELTQYLDRIHEHCRVVVVDGSPDPVFRRHQQALRGKVTHMRPAPDLDYLNGKVNGVITGVRAADRDRVVIADDDVRYDVPALIRVARLLDRADLVIPQNYFGPLPWHARWDTGRTLLNRCFGGDYPGTLAVRREAFHAAGCYDGDVLFENLELIRTMLAAGAVVHTALDVNVRRIPPQTRIFLSQRVRQAYDSLAQPGRLLAELAVLPACAAALATGRARWVARGVLAAIALAETGRRRGGGTAVFGPTAACWTPLWVAERAVCSWLAVLKGLSGGVAYAGSRIVRPANGVRALTARRRAEADHGVRAVAEGFDGRAPAPAQRDRATARLDGGPVLTGQLERTADQQRPVLAGDNQRAVGVFSHPRRVPALVRTMQSLWKEHG